MSQDSTDKLQMIFGKQVIRSLSPLHLFDAGIVLQDTHVPRAGRDLIRKTLEDANVPVSVGSSSSSARTTIH